MKTFRFQNLFPNRPVTVIKANSYEEAMKAITTLKENEQVKPDKRIQKLKKKESLENPKKSKAK